MTQTQPAGTVQAQTWILSPSDRLRLVFHCTGFGERAGKLSEPERAGKWSADKGCRNFSPNDCSNIIIPG
jgi:hypothetical protein